MHVRFIRTSVRKRDRSVLSPMADEEKRRKENKEPLPFQLIGHDPRAIELHCAVGKTVLTGNNREVIHSWFSLIFLEKSLDPFRRATSAEQVSISH